MNKCAPAICLLISSLISAPGWTLPGDRDRPIDVEADRNRGSLTRNEIEYLGNVRIDQGALTILGDRVIIFRDENDQIRRLEAYGTAETPARVSDQFAADQPVTRMWGQTIVYDSEQGIMTAQDDAWLRQGRNQVTAHYILYNLETEDFESATEAPDGSTGQRVNMCLIPESEAEEKVDVETPERPTACEAIR